MATPERFTLTLHPTDMSVEINGLVVRVWEGFTSGGIPVKAMISLIAVETEDQAAFDLEIAAHGGLTSQVGVEPDDAAMRRRAMNDPARN